MKMQIFLDKGRDASTYLKSISTSLPNEARFYLKKMKEEIITVEKIVDTQF
jgi:hypothetical protein